MFDNPLGFRKASQKQIAEMFWQKYSEDTPNAFTDFKELTVERRCKDEWSAFFIVIRSTTANTLTRGVAPPPPYPSNPP